MVSPCNAGGYELQFGDPHHSLNQLRGSTSPLHLPFFSWPILACPAFSNWVSIVPVPSLVLLSFLGQSRARTPGTQVPPSPSASSSFSAYPFCPLQKIPTEGRQDVVIQPHASAKIIYKTVWCLAGEHNLPRETTSTDHPFPYVSHGSLCCPAPIRLFPHPLYKW